MAGNNSIQFLRGNSAQRRISSETLLKGQPFYETDTKLLYCGNTDGELIKNSLPIGFVGYKHELTLTRTLNTNSVINIQYTFVSDSPTALTSADFKDFTTATKTLAAVSIPISIVVFNKTDVDTYIRYISITPSKLATYSSSDVEYLVMKPTTILYDRSSTLYWENKGNTVTVTLLPTRYGAPGSTQGTVVTPNLVTQNYEPWNMTAADKVSLFQGI